MLTLLALLIFSSDFRRLDDDSFDVRQAAEDRLTAHAWLAWRACDRPACSFEQRRRAARVCRYALDYGRTPTILAPIVWGWYRENDREWVMIGQVPGRPIDPERIIYVEAERLRLATQDLARALARAGVPPRLLRLWLDYFHYLERRW